MFTTLFSMITALFSTVWDLVNLIPSVIRNFNVFSTSLSQASALLVQLLNMFGL